MADRLPSEKPTTPRPPPPRSQGEVTFNEATPGTVEVLRLGDTGHEGAVEFAFCQDGVLVEMFGPDNASRGIMTFDCRQVNRLAQKLGFHALVLRETEARGDRDGNG